MDRLDFMILSVLKNNDAMNRLSAMTVREIACAEDFGWKENTLSKKVREFERSGHVGQGLKEGRANTYYITPKGCEYLKKERGMK